MRPLIVSRHAGAIQWLRETFPRLAEAEVKDQITAADLHDRAVFGNLPMQLASLCAEYYAVEFAGPPPRGNEYSATEMRMAGARLTRYIVQPADLPGWLTQS